MGFPKNFIWGAASADYQIEGAYDEDGKGAGIWDALSEGHVKHGENGNVACDHYHRYKEDVAIMKELGLKAYRFSVSWPRIMPREGEINEKGIQFYQNLVQELLDAGITPMCTLFHWNLPMWLHEKGGWHNEAVSDYFADYAKVVVDALSDKVSFWMTINEPLCFVVNGYITGDHAPFERAFDDMTKLMPTATALTRNALLAHGKAVKVIRENAKLTPRIGMALNGNIITPWGDSEEEIAAARAATFPDHATFSGLNWWADPMVKGTAPAMLANVFSDEDFEIICQPLDFFGFNCYNSGNYDEYTGKNEHVYSGMARTSMDWPITPDVLYWAVRFIHERYDLPVLITENGMANLDFVMSDGKVHDPQRIEFMKTYIGGLKKAVEEGIPVLGYLYWSIIDNFEWAEGYDKRFGLVHVDYRTQERTVKDSGYWYADLIRENGESLPATLHLDGRLG